MPSVNQLALEFAEHYRTKETSRFLCVSLTFFVVSYRLDKGVILEDLYAQLRDLLHDCIDEALANQGLYGFDHDSSIESYCDENQVDINPKQIRNEVVSILINKAEEFE